MPKSKIYYGKSVLNGVLRSLSVSSIEKADVNGHNGGGCEKAWHARYVMGWKPETQGKGAELGNLCHEKMEHWITTGENVLDRITGAAKKFAPVPTTPIGVMVEMALGGPKEDLSESLLLIEKVPVIGFIDIVDRRGQYLNEDASGFFKDPLNTVEILDWKFGKAKILKQDGSRNAACYAKTGAQLANDTQMTGYGLVPFSLWAETDFVRASHVYTNTDGTPVATKASILLDYETIEKRVDYTASVVRVMKDVAKEADWEKIQGNPNACESFGGCSYMEKCSTWKHGAGLASFYGGQEIERLALEGKLIMTTGLLQGITLPGMTPPVTASPAGVAATIHLKPHDIMSQIAQAANTAPASIAKPTYAFAAPQPDFTRSIGEIHAKGYGFVNLTGAAAEAYGVLNDHHDMYALNGPGYTVKGWGSLGGTTVDDQATVVGIAAQLVAHPQKQPAEARPSDVPMPRSRADVQRASAPAPLPVAAAPAILGILSPTAPKSDPALAADPVPGFVHPTAVTSQVLVPGLIASVPPAASAAILAATAPPASPTDGLPAAPPEPAKTTRKYTRKAKTDGASDVTVPSSTVAVAQEGCWLFVNTRPNIPTIDLRPIIQSWCDALARHHQMNPPDIRTGDGDHRLAFGKWKGHLAAAARFAVKDLDPGAYYLSTIGDEIAEAALDGLRSAKRGDDTEMVFELIVRPG